LRAFHVEPRRIESGILKPEPGAKVSVRDARAKLERTVRPVIKRFEFLAGNGPATVRDPASFLKIESV
jgi:hypothetical protein